jgi:hypothetical protein
VTTVSAVGLRVEALTEWFYEAKDSKLIVGTDGRIVVTLVALAIYGAIADLQIPHHT